MELKPATTFEEQIDLFKRRGLHLDIDPAPILSRINYYRFSGYFYPYLFKDDSGKEFFKEGTRLSTIYNAYLFDKELRSILSSILAHVEICLRTYIAYTIAIRRGADGHLDYKNFRSDSETQSIIDRIKYARERRKDLYFVDHHFKKNPDKFPIWVDAEIVPFDVLSAIYKNLFKEDQLYLNFTFIKSNPDYLGVWIDVLVKLRNHCAHCNRLYNQRYDNVPLYGIYEEDIDPTSLFARFIPIRDFLQEDLDWINFKVDFISLYETYESKIDLNYFKLPSNWKALLNRNYRAYNLKFSPKN